MGRLLGLELTRLRWRRAVVVLLAACLLVPAVIWVAMAVNTRPMSAAEIRQAEEQVAIELQQPYIRDEIERCIENPEEYGAPATNTEATCREFLEPRVDWYLHRQPLDLATEREGSGLGVITILAALAMLIGTTFVGHDWNSGSMSNQLLFEPRRRRVWLAKALAVLCCGLVTGAVVLGGRMGAGRTARRPGEWRAVGPDPQHEPARRGPDRTGRPGGVRPDDAVPQHRRDPGRTLRLHHRRLDLHPERLR